MSESSEEIKRWAARRKAVAVLDIINGKTTSSPISGIKRSLTKKRIP